MSTSSRFLRTIAVTAAVALGMLTAPAAALASFTDSDRATPQYSTASLAAPTAANVTMSCTYGIRATVIVNSFNPVTYANYHDIKVFDRSGTLEFTGDLSKSTGKTYTSG